MISIQKGTSELSRSLNTGSVSKPLAAAQETVYREGFPRPQSIILSTNRTSVEPDHCALDTSSVYVCTSEDGINTDVRYHCCATP